MTKQMKISFTEEDMKFLATHKELGYRNKSSLARAALGCLRKTIERRELELSAQLYAEVYRKDDELQELVNLNQEDWPE